MRFCSKIRGETILVCLRLRIEVVRLEKFLDVLDCLISGIRDIFFRYRCTDEVIGSSVLNIMLSVFNLEAHLLWV